MMGQKHDNVLSCILALVRPLAGWVFSHPLGGHYAPSHSQGFWLPRGGTSLGHQAHSLVPAFSQRQPFPKGCIFVNSCLASTLFEPPLSAKHALWEKCFPVLQTPQLSRQAEQAGQAWQMFELVLGREWQP